MEALLKYIPSKPKKKKHNDSLSKKKSPKQVRKHLTTSHGHHVHSKEPANTPTTARTLAALLKLDLESAPLAASVAEASAPEPDAVPVAAPEAEPEAEVEPPMAAAWNASNVLSGVGLTAKTIPRWQCLERM